MTILFVDLEHDHLQNDPALWELSRARLLQIKYRLEEISGDPCLIIRYDQITPDRVSELTPRALAVSGCYSDYIHYDPASLAGLRAVFKQVTTPIIGFCAGMQLMAETYGAKLAPIGFLAPGEPDPTAEGNFPAHVPGMIQERGFLPIEVTAPEHPLVAGLPTTPIVFQAHYWEVKNLPDCFETLARSATTPIQMIAHRTLPLFGTQFHTEQYNNENPDGRKILENFFKCL